MKQPYSFVLVVIYYCFASADAYRLPCLDQPQQTRCRTVVVSLSRPGKNNIGPNENPTKDERSIPSTKATSNEITGHGGEKSKEQKKETTAAETETTTSGTAVVSRTGSYKNIQIEEYEKYSRCLSTRQERYLVESEFENHNIWHRIVNKMKKVFYSKSKKGMRKKKYGALILLRCGESEFNHNQTFTGWLDPPLTDQGVKQSENAGRVLVTEGFDPDVVYTSRLQRSIVSAWHLLETIDALFIPVQKTFRLNQRMYGALQGLSKQETAEQFGPDVVQAWRSSLKARPPPLSRTDPTHPIHDRRYSDIPEDLIPDTESLLECQDRARQLWEHKIRWDIEQGKTVLVVAHRDSLRGLTKIIDDVNDNDISKVAIPTGVPVVYRFNGDMKPQKPEDASMTQRYTNGLFLEKTGRLRDALERNEIWNQRFHVDMFHKRVDPLAKSLSKLRRVEEDLGQIIRARTRSTVKQTDAVDYGEDCVQMIGEADTASKENDVSERWSDDPCEFEEYDEFSDQGDDLVPVTVLPLEDGKLSMDKAATQPEGPYVVLIRHGRTPHNNMQLFTGWEDPPLAAEGIEDAKNAGRTLKRHGFEFDVVYTSWLTRAIQTAYYALSELDSVWLPIIKSWRINERCYGDLTGKSKKMIANEYGEEQLQKWRRGYKIRPPPTSSYSLSYPGNDERRAKHFRDIRISFRETINRSIEKRKISIHRKFPKTESLKDCMDRSIPFYTNRIQREAIDKGKRVLITSHENAIRGILMHLCDIPREAMNQLHIPNGLPLVYDVKGRCISLLDSGGEENDTDKDQNPSIHARDFGPAARYLFKPCDLDDSFFEEK